MFQDLKVLELASVLAGPAVGMFFSELGAKVTKIENKTTNGDVTRKWKIEGEKKENSISAYYASVNWNKHVHQYDLSDEKDQKSVQDMVKEADIVISNFKKGSAKKFKIDYKTLKSINPQIIYGHISGYGDDSDRPAFDVVLQAETGFMSMNGTPESGPVKIPIALIDMLAAHQLKQALLIALLHKAQKKEGSYVSVSLYDAAIAALSNQAGNWLMVGKVPQKIGTLHPNIAPYGDTFKTQDDQEIVLAIGTDKQFKVLCKLLNQEKLVDDPRLNTNANRVINRTYLRAQLESLFLKTNGSNILQTLHKHYVPAGTIKNMKEVFEQEKAQRMVLSSESEGVETKCVKSIAFQANFLN